MQQRAAGDELILIIFRKCSCVHKLLMLNSLLHFISQTQQSVLALHQISSGVNNFAAITFLPSV